MTTLCGAHLLNRNYPNISKSASDFLHRKKDCIVTHLSQNSKGMMSPAKQIIAFAKSGAIT